jgi:uncharacterized membrane protein YqjE
MLGDAKLEGWQKHYVLVIAIHVFGATIVALTVMIIQCFKPAYGTGDLLMIIAAGMIVGTIYIKSMERITENSNKS